MNNNIHWGKDFWDLIHNISILYPENPTENDIKNFDSFIKSFQILLPCEQCRSHFKNNLDYFPISSFIEKKLTYSNSRDGIVLWTIKMHNKVNKLLSKFITVTENKIGIDYIKKKYITSNTILILKNVLKHASNKISKIDTQTENAYSELFYSVAYFLFNKNVDIVKILNTKMTQISFKTKNSIEKIYQNII